MPKTKNLASKIVDLLSQEKWSDAATLLDTVKISGELAFFAIYAGIESRDEKLVDKGIAAALRLLEKPSSVNPLSGAYYNLGNAYQYKATEYLNQNNTYFGAEKIIEKAIKYFSKALELEHDPRIITNLGNLLDELGRPLEALAHYDKALHYDMDFGMAIGNKAMLLEHLSGITTYQGGYLIYAYQLYEQALKHKDSILSIGGNDAYNQFVMHRDHIKKHYADNNQEELLAVNLSHEHHSPNVNKTVEDYTAFCLENDLYLNLHIFDKHSTGSVSDNVSTSLITTIADDDAKRWVAEVFMRLNEIKESYMTGRYTLWLSQQKTPAMSKISEQSLLVNNLDYTAHNLYTGLLKTSYKEVFSVLDKVANFLNYYLELGNDENNPYLNYRKIWYTDLNKTNGFHSRITSENYRLFGIYSLLNELGEAPSVERNTLEHRYKRISTIGLDPYGAPTFSEFTQQTVDVYYKVKCVIIYLLNFINYTEDAKRKEVKKHGGIIPSMPVISDQWLDLWENK